MTQWCFQDKVAYNRFLCVVCELKVEILQAFFVLLDQSMANTLSNAKRHIPKCFLVILAISLHVKSQVQFSQERFLSYVDKQAPDFLVIEESDVLLSDDDHTDKSNAAVLLGQLEIRG